MKEEGRLWWAVERVRLALLVVGMGACAVVVLGGMTGKSTAWTGSPGGAGYGWTDGVKPWAVWSFVGGVVATALLLVGCPRGDALCLPAGAGAFLLWQAGNQASAYRTRIEGGILTMYDRHTVSFGLRVVPVVGRIGAYVVGALALVTLGVRMSWRFAVSDRARLRSGRRGFNGECFLGGRPDLVWLGIGRWSPRRAPPQVAWVLGTG